MTIARVTTRDLESMPIKEGWRYEIIDGELYVSTTPSWQHQYVCVALSSALYVWNLDARLGVVLAALGVIFAEDDNVAPDILWISHERLAAFAGAGGHLYGAPELMIEVLSPGRSNQMRDREAKLDLYGRKDVLEYWLVDWETRTIAVYRRDGSSLVLADSLDNAGTLTSHLLPGFACPVSSLFPTTPAPQR